MPRNTFRSGREKSAIAPKQGREPPSTTNGLGPLDTSSTQLRTFLNNESGGPPVVRYSVPTASMYPPRTLASIIPGATGPPYIPTPTMANPTGPPYIPTPTMLCEPGNQLTATLPFRPGPAHLTNPPMEQARRKSPEQDQNNKRSDTRASTPAEDYQDLIVVQSSEHNYRYNMINGYEDYVQKVRERKARK